MKHSPFLLVSFEIGQIYDPIGDCQLVMDGLETGANLCAEASALSQVEDSPDYSRWLAQVRQTEILDGFKRDAHLHKAELLMLELIYEQDLKKHAAAWLSIRAALLTEVSLLRQKVSPATGANIVH